MWKFDLEGVSFNALEGPELFTRELVDVFLFWGTCQAPPCIERSVIQGDMFNPVQQVSKIELTIYIMILPDNLIAISSE